MSNIEERLENIEKSLEELKDLIKTLINTTSRMDGHISFVEDTYATLSHPLTVLKNSVERIFPGGNSLKEK